MVASPSKLKKLNTQIEERILKGTAETKEKVAKGGIDKATANMLAEKSLEVVQAIQ